MDMQKILSRLVTGNGIRQLRAAKVTTETAIKQKEDELGKLQALLDTIKDAIEDRERSEVTVVTIEQVEPETATAPKPVLAPRKRGRPPKPKVAPEPAEPEPAEPEPGLESLFDDEPGEKPLLPKLQ